MPTVTITNSTDVGEMKTDVIRHWISLHQRSLKDKEMTEHWKEIQKDLDVLKSENDLRHPEVQALWAINETLLLMNETLKSLCKGAKNVLEPIQEEKGETDGRTGKKK
jgi:hypothetical protein